MNPFEHHPRPGVIDQPVDFEFMAPNAWLDFNCELYDVVSELDLDVERIDAGVIRLRNGRSLALLQLAQHCHLRPREDWSELIDAHLRTMTAHLSSPTDAGTEPLSMFDLRVRLVPDDPADHDMFGELGARPFAEGIVQVLAVDVPGAIRVVPEREIDELAWDADEAWASAWAQTEALEQHDEVNVIDVGGADVVHIFGERVFNASLIRTIEDVVGTIGSNGALVSMPHSHSVLVHPIEDASVAIAINGLIAITRQLFRQGPGSISPHLYWWRNGELTCVPTYFASDGIEAYPSPELSDILRRIR